MLVYITEELYVNPENVVSLKIKKYISQESYYVRIKLSDFSYEEVEVPTREDGITLIKRYVRKINEPVD